MQVSAVIGANYGDEGKGVITDALAFRRPDSIVVLTNGGAQRGHTVLVPGGRGSHVFHHFGSGTFRGCLTYFPKFYILNPMQFAKEYRELSDGFGLGQIKTARHPDCTFTTPFDMILNQDIETWRKRNGKPFGTCGMGVWETLVRNAESFSLAGYYDKFRRFVEAPIDSQVKWLKWIRDEYCPRRFKSVTGEPWRPADYTMDNGLIEHFLSDVKFMSLVCPQESRCYETIAKKDASIIFENGQGLLLDEEYAGSENSKYSTPSHTGMCFVNGILQSVECNFGIKADSVDAYYVSRPYMTRHGPGPLKNTPCGDSGSVLDFADYTNSDNEFQGAFRQVPIDLTAQAALISRDAKNYLYTLDAERTSVTLAYTHVDQMMPEQRFFTDIAECGSPVGADAVTGLKW